jgi:hypothetical protein
LPGKGCPVTGSTIGVPERREVARARGEGGHRGEDVERRIGVVAVVVEDEAGLRLAFRDAGNLQRAAEREGVPLLEVLGLVGRLARQRVRRRVERRAREGHRQEPADLLVPHSAAERKSGRAATLAEPALAEPALPEAAEPAAPETAAAARSALAIRPRIRTKRLAAGEFAGFAAREAFGEQWRVQLPGRANADDRLAGHVLGEASRQRRFLAAGARGVLIRSAQARAVGLQAERLERPAAGAISAS